MFALLTSDRMRLYLVKDRPEDEVFTELQDEGSLNSWLKQLRGLGVPQDLMKLDVIKSLCESSEKPFGEHLIAEGIEPVDEGVELVYYFEAMKSPAEDEDEKADYYQLGFGVDVVEGQLLAKQETQGPGKDGVNVIGSRLSFTTHTRTNPLLYNSNVYIEKESKVTQFFSKIKGVLLNHNLESLDVFPNFHIKGSVGFKTGNLNTDADIEIDGDVKAGFSIRSGNNITIKGVVEKNTVIESGGDIVIEGGISAGAHIQAGGKLHLKFAQGARLMAKGDIKASSYIYDCEVMSTKTIYCYGNGSESRGAVIGGLLNAMESIELVSVGSQNALTHLVVGINYYLKKEHKKLIQLKTSLQEEVKRLVRLLPLDLLDPNFKSAMKALPTLEKKACRQKITQIISHRREIESLGAQIDELAPEAMTQNLEAQIKISKALFPDVKVTIGPQYNLLQEEYGPLVLGLNQSKPEA